MQQVVAAVDLPNRRGHFENILNTPGRPKHSGMKVFLHVREVISAARAALCPAKIVVDPPDILPVGRLGVGAALAVLLFGEPFTVQLATAAGLMLLGVCLHLTEIHEHEHIHEALEHEHRHVHDSHHDHVHSPADPSGEPHTHWHRHISLVHKRLHYPDLHHGHGHSTH